MSESNNDEIKKRFLGLIKELIENEEDIDLYMFLTYLYTEEKIEDISFNIENGKVNCNLTEEFLNGNYLEVDYESEDEYSKDFIKDYITNVKDNIKAFKEYFGAILINLKDGEYKGERIDSLKKSLQNLALYLTGMYSI